MATEQKREINAKLKDMWFHFKILGEMESASELVGFLECLLMLGYKVTGWNENNKLTKCPTLLDVQQIAWAG